MSDRSWVTRLFGSGPRTSRSRAAGRSRPTAETTRLALEVLEDRLSPATLTVNSTQDTSNSTDPYLSLREAVALVNSSSLPSGLSTQIQGQVSGPLHTGGTDTILFDSTRVTGPITLTGTQLELSQPRGTATITIDGGTGVTLDGAGRSRIFQVDSGVQVALNHLTLTHGMAPGAATAGAGGAVTNRGTLSLSNSTLSANTANTDGGAVYNIGGASLTVTNSTLSLNLSSFTTSALGGGGIYNNLGTVTVSNSLLSGNSARQGGGVFNNGGTVTVNGSTLRANSAFTGGAIKNYPPSGRALAVLTVANSALLANTASTGGGGISNVSSRASATVTGSTFAADLCQMSRGGAILNNTGQMAITSCTLSSNTAGLEGGGIYNDSTLTLRSTIVARNLSQFGVGTDVYSIETAATGSYNLIGVGDTLRGISDGDANHNQVGTASMNLDPVLSPVGPHGGPTDTFAVLPGSPALGRADPGTTLTTDQRGQPRSRGGQVDVGAYQNQGFTLTPFPSASVSAAVTRPFTVGVRVTANDPGLTNLTGGTMTLAVTTALTGATATLRSGNTVALGTATDYPLDLIANTITGIYTLTARAGADMVNVGLTNTPGPPDAITVVAGDGQGTTVSTPFPTPLQVSVTDPYGNPVPGLMVTFAGPTTGAGVVLSGGGMATTDVNGLAQVTAAANARPGRYTVTASAGPATPATFSLGNSEQPSLFVDNLVDESDPFHGVSLRDAINYAEFLPPAAYTIQFNPVALPDPVNNVILLETPLPVLSGVLTIQGPATNNVTIQMDPAAVTGFTVFTVASRATVNFSHLTVSGGAGTLGGGISASGATVTVTNCTLSGNSANTGAGIYQSGGTLTISNSALRSNTADFSGGGLYVSGTATVSNTTLAGNQANTGGGLYSDAGSSLTVSSCTLSGNSATDTGAGVYQTGGALSLTGCMLQGNNSDFVAGGLYSSGGISAVANSTLSANFALLGGGVYVESNSNVILTSDTLSGNSASISGDGGGGAGVYASASSGVTISNCTLVNNSVTNPGGVGGAIHGDPNSFVTLSNSTLSGNYAAAGGGIDSVAGQVTVSNSTLFGNTARFDGGGIEESSGILLLSGCTLTGNLSNNGGGLSVNQSLATISATIIAGNSATTALDVASDLPVDSQGHNLIGIIDASSGWLPDTDLTGTPDTPLNPRLSALGYYGGPTQTCALLPGSPALGQGAAPTTLTAGVDDLTTTLQVGNASLLSAVPNTTVLLIDNEQVLVQGVVGNTLTVQRGVNGTTAAFHTATAAVFQAGDQRGQPRTRAGVADIGAFQTQANPFLVTTRQDPGQLYGLLSLREAVNLADVLPGANSVSFAGTLAGGTISLSGGQLELSGTGGVQTIDGGYRFTITGNNSSRLFQIDAGTQAVLRGFILTGGSAGNGGAVLNQGTLTVDNSTLRGNSASNGGAIYNMGTLTLRSSTLGFGTSSQGAGVYNAGTLTAFNSTFASNSASTAGGAIFNAGSGTATLTSLTISQNTAAIGSGISVAGTVLLRNCIVARNFAVDGTTPSDVTGTVSASSSYDLIGTGGSGGLTGGVNHNLVGVADPRLTAPDFGSNQTPVFTVQAGSPALGAGDPTLLSDPDLRLDQHGNMRSNPPNIGAI